jgi:transposase
MGSYVMPVIVESADTLKKQLSQQRSGRLKERLQVVYLLKSEQARDLNTLARLVGRDRATVMRWLERYRVGGLERLVELGYRQCGRPGVLPAPVRSALQACLADPEQGFASYGEIQQWLATDWGVTVKYPTVHRIVRYQLRAKLKVPRPRHIDQSPAEVVGFKKKAAATPGCHEGALRT